MSRYLRVINGTTVDVYDILNAYGVCNPAAQHAIKKLLMPGQRGGKGQIQDLHEALLSVERAMQLAAGHGRPAVDSLLIAHAAVALLGPDTIAVLEKHFTKALSDLSANGGGIGVCIEAALRGLEAHCLATIRPVPEVVVEPDAVAEDQPAVEHVEPQPEDDVLTEAMPLPADDVEGDDVLPAPWDGPDEVEPCCDVVVEDQE